ncbi:ATP-grasp domain-containing protein [Salibacterium salarium]|uniref:ATP-grasp domain-containing protein n=1 Tax=Salibacterium salarium TaxID=284579 RepID=A0A3R9P483_9BACI|nr:ATP-grasp domain-containing protein [Salibacterium salarium]RSL29993.1 ATP-grasp domain-containing protein [Salibacterium salarium]
MNILICSAGRRVKLIEYFKRQLKQSGGKVVAVDCDPTAPTLEHADWHEVVPRINDPDYIPRIKRICDDYQINGVLSLIDPELSLLAGVKEEFQRKNITMIVSNKDVVDICLDKYLTYQYLRLNEIPVVPTYLSFEEVVNDIHSSKRTFPLIAKPKTGSASLGVKTIHSIGEWELMDKKEHYIIQPFIEGDEIGVDCYIDLLSKEVTHIFCKKKVIMRSGETDRSVSMKDPALLEMIQHVAKTLHLSGPVDIDCFKTENGYMISEINPRFGGGYLHAHEAGQDFIRSICNNLNGAVNRPDLANYEADTTMVKFDNVMVMKNKVHRGENII